MRPPDDVAGTRTTSAPLKGTPLQAFARLRSKVLARPKSDEEVMPSNAVA